MAHPVEAEFKVGIDAGDVKRLLRLGAIEGFDLAAPADRRMTTTYFDTADRRLRQRGASLRLRRVGREGEQTLKLGGSFALGLAARPEFTSAHAGRTPDLAKIEDEAVRADLTALLGEEPLAPLFVLTVRRRVWTATSRAGDVVEIVLDQGEVKAGEAVAPISEMEFELVSGDRRALFEAAKSVLAGVAFRLSGRTKADAGFDLVDGKAVAAAAPVFADDVAFEDDLPAEAALQACLRSAIGQIAGNVAAVRASRDAEGPHQLRVGLRRLRSIFASFSRMIAPEAAARLKQEAKWLAAEVGAVRDLDVLIDDLVGSLAGVADMTGLVELLETRRSAAHERLASVMADRRTSDFLIDLIAFTEGRGWLSATDLTQSGALVTPIARHAEKLVDRMRGKVARMARDPEALSPEARHELRKKLKALRYSFDFFSSVLDKGLRKKLLPRLKAAQDVLGALNDIHMAHLMLDGVHGEGPQAAAIERSIGFCLGWHEARARAIWAEKSGLVQLD